MLKCLQFFRPAPHICRLPQERINPHYKSLRWKVFAGIFIGYTSFYFLRNNFSLAIPYLEQQGFRLLRFWNSEVFSNLDRVLQQISQALEISPHPGPLPEGEGNCDRSCKEII